MSVMRRTVEERKTPWLTYLLSLLSLHQLYWSYRFWSPPSEGLALNSLMGRQIRNKLPVSSVAACGHLGILQRRSIDISWHQTQPLVSRHLCCQHRSLAHTSAGQALQHALMSQTSVYGGRVSQPKTRPSSLVWILLATSIMELTLEMDHSLRMDSTWSSKVAKKHLLPQLMIAGKWRREGVLGRKGVAQAKQGEETEAFVFLYLSVPAFAVCWFPPGKPRNFLVPLLRWTLFLTRLSLQPLSPLHRDIASLFQRDFPCSTDTFLSLSEWELCLSGSKPWSWATAAGGRFKGLLQQVGVSTSTVH